MEHGWGGKLIAEGIGTFALIFVGAGTILSLPSTVDPGAGRVAVALAHGLAIGVMVSALGHVSGGHFNPAVTIAAAVTRKIKADLVIPYIATQLLGSALAAAALASVFPYWAGTNIGNTEPAGYMNFGQTILVEAILTFFLVLVIFGTAIDKKGSWSAVAGMAIGFTITLDILVGGGLTGGAMNPARSFGPTFVAFAGGVTVTGVASGSENLWVNHLLYWVGPVLGGVMAAGLYNGMYLRDEK